MKKDGIAAALNRAFSWHWNLLGLGVGTAFAFLSGQPAAWLPVVAACELAYLGFLGMNPRFQNVLRGRTMIRSSKSDPAAAQLRYQQITSFLTETDLNRFRQLQSRCAALLDLRRRMDAKENDNGPDHFRGDSLDRMLWLFLKLLHQRSGLERFLASTQRGQIDVELRAAEDQLAVAQERDAAAAGVESRLTTSIRDRIQTIGDRLRNYDKACENLELVSAEIEKTEQQITHLCEVGMTTRDSADLSVQIDSISESLQSSERAFAHASVTSFLDDEAAPPLLSAASGQPPPIPQKISVSQ